MRMDGNMNGYQKTCSEVQIFMLKSARISNYPRNSTEIVSIPIATLATSSGKERNYLSFVCSNVSKASIISIELEKKVTGL